MEKQISTEYEGFLLDNRVKVNRYLNIILWFFVLTGPALAAGVHSGIFDDISYITCINISVIVIVLSAIHRVLLIRIPKSTVTCLFALTALNFLIMYMACSNVNIYLTWFLVPVLSLLFCDLSIYFYAIVLNYILMFMATYYNSFHLMTADLESQNTAPSFANKIGGFTIETIIMIAAGLLVGKLTTAYFKSMFSQYKKIDEQEKSMQEKMNLLDSMAEIYDNVNLIDFVNNTETSLRDAEHKTHGIDMSAQTHTLMVQKIKNQVMPDQIDAFMTFTNLKTVRSRLAQKKILSADFIDVVTGWFRAQYITVESTIDGIPNIVIYTTRNVDEEKRREENLIRISLTDEMTRLYNRRCYDEDLTEIRKEALGDDFVLFSVDVNGLKTVNDTLGHGAGDELIKGAADCLAVSVGNLGKVYRTGGDEFMAIVSISEPEKLRETIKEKAAEWHGIYSEEMTMSVGYAAHKDHPDASIDDIEHLADKDMYLQKGKFYEERGIDRRR